MSPDPDLVELLLAQRTPEVAALTRMLRALIREILVDIPEWVDTPDGLIAYGTSKTMKGEIVYLKPLPARVNVGFFHGAKLPDPAGLLEGTGKSLRHVKVSSIADGERPALRALIVAARAERS